MVLGLLAAGTAATAAATATSGTVARTPRTIHLVIRYSKFQPDTFDVRPGERVRFVVHNLDPIGHELIIGDRGLHERHEHGTEAHHGARPGEVSVDAGSVAATTFVFGAPGEVLFGCHLPGHWDYGMHGRIHVA